MSQFSQPRFAASPGNRLLVQLDPAARRAIEPHLRPVALKAGQTLFLAHEKLQTAYFPESGAISLLARSTHSDLLELGVVGKDGMAGIALIPGVNTMPYDAVVQMSGLALRIAADRLRETIQKLGSFHQLLGRYAYTVFAGGVQTAVCNNFHPIGARCARWLLMLHDLADGDRFPLTQNLLALMLGVRRPTVTGAATALQREGLVEYHHGRMAIRNRRGLEAASCECYRAMRDEQRRLLGY